MSVRGLGSTTVLLWQKLCLWKVWETSSITSYWTHRETNLPTVLLNKRYFRFFFNFLRRQIYQITKQWKLMTVCHSVWNLLNDLGSRIGMMSQIIHLGLFRSNFFRINIYYVLSVKFTQNLKVKYVLLPILWDIVKYFF